MRNIGIMQRIHGSVVHYIPVLAVVTLLMTWPAMSQPVKDIESRFKAGQTLYVMATALALRQEPSIDSTRLYYISRDDTVRMLASTEPLLQFSYEGRTGYWIPVQHGDHQGYVFDGFLSPDTTYIQERHNWEIEPGVHVGPITANTKREDLVAHYGAGKVIEVEVDDGGEGDTMPGVKILVNSDDEIAVVWHETPRKWVDVFITKPNGRWITKSGFGIGTSLNALVQINGKHLKYAGFWFDHSGAVTDWNDGHLSKIADVLSVRLTPQEPYSKSDLKKLFGDSAYSSGHPATAGANLVVSWLRVRLYE